MPLATGTRLGSCEIVTAIGAGGMGEVYRATDMKLDRDVAIKVLPESFALMVLAQIAVNARVGERDYRKFLSAWASWLRRSAVSAALSDWAA